MKMVIIVLLLLVSQHASGVEVYEGVESVLLPCQVPADVSRNSTSAVWKRDGFKNPTIHLHLQSGDNLEDQNNHYHGRTSMRVNALQTGDLSLTLRKPRVSDSGNYTCTALKAGQTQRQTQVQLKVKVPPPVWPKVLLAALVPLIILAAAFGLFVCCAYVRMKKRTEAPQPEMVKVPQGEESVLLPFKTTADLLQAVTVEWRHNNMKVHVYESGNNQPDKQHQDYRGRTEMNKDPLRNKDLSLKLKHLHLTDSGVYTCTVYNKDGHMLLWKSVILSVRVPQPEVVEVLQGQKSAELPFKTKAELPQNVTVEWTVTEPKHMKVHVYESGNNQPDKQHQDYRGRTEMHKDPLRTKDLSLTLKHLHLTDSGVYTCTVYNKHGHMLLQKSVTLSVRELQTEVVEVPQAEKFVRLPFKPTVDIPQDVTVEWRRLDSNNMKVHVYESGKYQPDKQHKFYSNRTEMHKDPLTNKDLSLTLKDLRFTDSGVYICTIYNKHGNKLIQKSVTLSFKDLQTEVKEVQESEKSVVLPFKTKDDLPQEITVEWKLTEPKHMKVHVYESGNNQPVKQDEGYIGRTEMNEDPLTNKDLSLTLKDLRLTDSGVYTCTIYNKDGNKLIQKSVTLSFKDLQPVEVGVEVTQVEEFVLLPFQTTADLPWDVIVQWTDSKLMKLYEYENGNQPHRQHQGYRGRTEMNEDPLRTKDLSLKLKHLLLTDSGFYTCTVYKDGHKLIQKSVTLSFKVPQPEVVEVPQGQRSVLLPFKPTAGLPQDVTVEWTLTEPKHTKVHVYESGKYQPDKKEQDYRGRTEMDEDPLNTKDLSLTLKDLHLTDSGVYTCTVYSKDGNMLIQKSVTLSVRDLQPKVVEVTQGEKSVLLPFMTTADLPHGVTVEWTLTEPKRTKVHVYEIGNNRPDKQDQGYRGRTEMKEDPLRTKDFSLTLKDLHLTDSGVYTCTVYNKDGHMLLQKSVILIIRATLMGTMAEMLPHSILRSRQRRAQPDQEHRNRSQEEERLTAEETV